MTHALSPKRTRATFGSDDSLAYLTKGHSLRKQGNAK